VFAAGVEGDGSVESLIVGDGELSGAVVIECLPCSQRRMLWRGRAQVDCSCHAVFRKLLHEQDQIRSCMRHLSGVLEGLNCSYELSSQRSG
jgi:hypothetical protein